MSLGSAKGPELAYFGEIHPSIIKKLDLRTDNVLGFEIFLDNIPKSRKKLEKPSLNLLFPIIRKWLEILPLLLMKNIVLVKLLLY